MIENDEQRCPKCGGELKHYDSVRRIIKSKYGKEKQVIIQRLQCVKCHTIHRELKNFVRMQSEINDSIAAFRAELITGIKIATRVVLRRRTVCGTTAFGAKRRIVA